MQEHKKLLVIGSAVADVIINLDHLPRRREDVHVITQEMRLGGCAYNTYDIVRKFNVPSIPFFPIGTGAYGDFVRKEFEKREIRTPLPTPCSDNGCCYCYIEADGERTFLSYHGAEYRFEADWFSLLNEDELDSVYICGLEIEEPTGIHIISFLENLKQSHPDITIFFAPGPRIPKIPQEKMIRILKLQPILHLNDDEALSLVDVIHGDRTNAAVCPGEKEKLPLSSKPEFSKAEFSARILFQETQSPVLVTLGEKGCAYFDGERFEIIPAIKTRQIDSVGAGDAHIGAVMSCLKKGFALPDAIRMANRISARVVSVSGALLTREEFLETVSE